MRENKKVVTFLGELVLDFSYLKKFCTRRDKKVTLFLAITNSGVLLKPLIVLGVGIKLDVETSKHDLPALMYTEDGNPDERTLIDWVDKCLLPSTNRPLLLTSSLSIYSNPAFETYLSQHSVQHMYLPRGVSCKINPLKDVLPLLKRLIMSGAESSEYIKKHVRVSMSMVLGWIEDGIAELNSAYASALRDAFLCFK